ncbi:unnamed protein product [Euphydryas editha]|uniref:BED-type domain-containing protein n=1 Tax=Euphydryas editha TaxID=104508 RepID=A0AAU9UV35_EUPED|nr:unnamed protein product [Euphydryas editha]
MASVNNRISVVWDHFVDIGGYFATCNICKVKLSFKSSVTNLKKHMERKHPTVRIINRKRNGGASAGENCTFNFSGHIVPSSQPSSQPSAQPSSEPVQLSSEPAQTSAQSSAPPSSQPPRRTYSHQLITNFVPRRANTAKSEIDKKIMNLFIKDFQPFRVVEDRGFRELISFAFPNYTIPSRKFFSNNMLPAIFEKTKADLKEKVLAEVQSVCLTLDVWSTSTNDSMLAVTGHYIKEEDFELKSFLLDCVPLTENHTAKNLAEAIKVISDDWRVTDKILLAVTDNGNNIKSAIEKELGWKHFPCYTHTLNLAVNDSLKEKEITDIIAKIKGIVRHFKHSNVAWEKLKKYQEQAGATAKRLLQDVPTRWNSKFYMLMRCVELREPLNSALINLGMETVTNYEWTICKEMCVVLQPCEEVTRELSGQKYITGSLVIPITIGLTKALENLGQQNIFMPLVERLRQDLIGNIKKRFLNLNQSKTFANCMFLDPRFKFYFDDAHVADETKRRIIGLVAAQHPSSDKRVEAIQSMVHTPSQTQSIWQDFENKMLGIQPEITPQSRAIVEVQRYYDDKVIPRTDCPMKWWRSHQAAYPTLYKIAVKKLNAMSSSVPCERVFSAAGNIMQERRTRLGIRKLQQLIFLQQNL